ncbi:MAG: zf-HC2 domain-containing protein [Oscillospiraceae bacterium]|nr:zf-HC2 domain-containing protein [Oscillospiraceae bacterium]
MKVSCDIIRDILPLYAEDMVSKDTKELVEEHLGECESCTDDLKLLRKAAVIPKDVELWGMNAVKKSIQRRRILTALMVFLLTAAVAIGLFAFLTRPIALTAEEAEARVIEYGDKVYIEFGENVDCYSKSIQWDGSHSLRFDITVTAYRRLWNVHYGNLRLFEGNAKNGDGGEYASGTRRICYGNGEKGEESTVLWGEPLSDHVIELPRLVLNYYNLIALACGLALLGISFLLRRRSGGSWAFCGAMLFLCYIAAGWVVTGGEFLIYIAEDLPIYLGMILVCTIFLWCAFLCGRSLYIMNRRERSA